MFELNPFAIFHDVDVPTAEHLGEPDDFANSLYGFLYFRLNMHHYRPNNSRYFRNIIGSAVLSIQKKTHRFHKEIMQNYGNTLSNSCRRSLCQKICTLYPDDDYFKKLYYMSAFILEVIIWGYNYLDDAKFSFGVDLWLQIFKNNFEDKFEHHGGWLGFFEAGYKCEELDVDDILPSETLLPEYFHGVVASVRIPRSLEVNVDEALEGLGNLAIRPMEIDAPGDEAGPVKKPDVKENQLLKAAQVQEQIEESEEIQPEELDVPCSCRPKGDANVIPSDIPSEGTSEKAGEGPMDSHRSLRKRRRDIPPKDDSDPEQEPSKSKLDKK